jgi:Ca-activated chloride channel family protein
MTFHSPHVLWLLLPLVLLFSWELARHATAAANLWPKIRRAWAGAFSVSPGTMHTTAETRPRIWLWFGLAFAIVALARPQWGVVEEQVFDQSREVLIAVDLSKSMLAPDVKPTRLDRAKLLIESLLDRLKGERVGLILFSGTAFTQSPLSADYEILREFLPALKPDYLPESGTDYKAMLETAVEAFGTTAADRYLIVLSDGESTVEGWQAVAQELKKKSIRVVSLGIGTAQGAFIPDAAGGFLKDERGAVVLSRLGASTLQELAQITGGAYSDASAWVDLPALLQKTVETGRKGEFSEKNTARKIERFQWFLAPAALLLLVSFWVEFPVRPRERALPMAGGATRKTVNSGLVTATAILLVLLSAFSIQSSAFAAEGADALAKPLSTTVARLSAKDALSAKDCAELAQTTLTYGQRAQGAGQPPVESAVRDALTAVDLGEKMDAKSADWPRLREELEKLLQKQEPPPQQQNQQQQQQDKKDKQDQQQQQNQQNQDQQKKDDQQQNQDQQSQQQEKQNQDAFGDMKENKEQKAEEEKQPPKPQGGTQKVGGQQEKKPAEQKENPDLAMPLQKLEQVKEDDSPAKLYQLMRGQQQKKQDKGKNW